MIYLGGIQPSLDKRKVQKQLKMHAFHPSCFSRVLFASRAAAIKTKQQAKLVFKPGPYAGSAEAISTAQTAIVLFSRDIAKKEKKLAKKLEMRLKAIKTQVFLFWMFSLSSWSQEIIDKNPNYGFGLELGYSYRKGNELNGGLNFLFYSKTDYKSASLFGASLDRQIIFLSNPYFGIRGSIEYLYWSKRKTGFQFNISSELNKLVGLGIDSRLGLNYGGVYYLFYGYNFYRKSYDYDLSKHSIGILFRLNWAVFDLGYK